MLLELEDIERARDRIDGRVHVTPMMSSTSLGDELGVRLHLKAELFQKTGSFKPRGVFNKLLSMDPAVRSRGLVSLSAGNHAAALAYGATAVGAKGHDRDAGQCDAIQGRGDQPLRRPGCPEPRPPAPVH